MRVKWNRNLDGSSSSGCEEPGPLERRGSLRKPTPPPSAKDEPFKKSWSFRLGTSKDKEPGDKSVFLRMFRFGKDKKRVQQEVSSRRRMSDAGGSAQGQVLKEELTQWSSVPVELSESPEIRRRQDLVLMRAHTLPRSLEAGLVGDGGAPDDTDANVWGVIYCDPRPQLHKDKLPRVTLETSTNREAEERAKVFSSAVLPHFTHSAGEVKGLDEDKRGLKRLLLNGHPSTVQCAAPSSQDDAVFAQGQDRVSPPGSLSGHCIEVPAKMDPSPDGDNRHVDDMAAGGCPTDVDALAVLEDDVSSHLPTGTVDCPSSSSTFVVELNHGYRDESDDSQRPEPSEDSDADRLLPAFASVSHGAVLENGNVEGCFEDSCVVDIEAPSDEHWEDEFGVTENSHGTYDATMELSQLLDTCRQNRGSVSTSSSCEECTAQDEFEFVPADPPVIQLQRTSRDIECCDIECSVSDVFESYPLREKASFIFFEEDCAEQPSGSSLLSTPDDGPAGDPFVLVDGDEEVSVQGICSDSELDPVDLGDSGEQEEREVRIVDQLREVTTPDDPRGCNAVIDTHLEVTERPVPVTSDLPASSTEERPQDDMLPEATGEGIQNDGSPREMEMSTETRGDVLFVVEFRSGQSDGTKLDTAQLDGHREIEAEETSRSLKDRIHFFNSISQESTPEPPLPIARHTRVSKIPTPSRLPRLSSRPAKDSSPLAPAPVPAKRTRLGGRPAHIPLPCRIRRHPGSLQANSGTHSDPNINLHVADDATAKGPKCKSSTPSVLPEGLSQLKRSGTFVLEDSDPPPQPAPSQGPPRVTVAGVRPFEYKDKNVECDANVAQEPTARTDPCVSITEQQTPASFSIFSVQVPVVDSTDPTEHPEKTPDVCACGRKFSLTSCVCTTAVYSRGFLRCLPTRRGSHVASDTPIRSSFLQTSLCVSPLVFSLIVVVGIPCQPLVLPFKEQPGSVVWS